MQIRLASDLQTDSIVDGKGIRTVLWTQGCPHHCKGCHNPTTHKMDGGFVCDTEAIKEQIKQLEGQDGITLSGGDPMVQSEACMEIAQYAKSLGMNVWCYTGYTYEEVLEDPSKKALLESVDVLVDGKFVLEERSLDLFFKGSKNQRIIDVPKSLNTGKVCLIEEYEKEKNIHSLYEKKEHMFL